MYLDVSDTNIDKISGTAKSPVSDTGFKLASLAAPDPHTALQVL